jgi:YegS/Rv2252/BmrU family lipid kinase
MKTAAIVNPRSGGGKTARRWPEIERALVRRLGPIEVRRTERPGHAIELARALLEQGFDRIIAAGGDGTIHEAANGFLLDDQPIRPAAALGILPLGTGGDFRRTLGILPSLPEAVDVLAAGKPLTIDMGKASFRGHDGARHTRYFINLLSFGMGGDVAARSNNFLSPLGGTVAFFYASAVGVLRYRRKQVRLELDGTASSASIYNVAVGNGRFHGGGMQICPTADPTDGVLEVTVIDYMTLAEVILDFRVLYSDNVYRHRKVHHLRARRLVAESSDLVRFEIDGEPLGTLPLEITVLPQRIAVLVPPSSPLLRLSR